MPHTTNPVVFRLGKNVSWEILDNHLYFARSLRQQIILNSFIVNFLESYDFKLVKYSYRSEKYGLKIAVVAFKRRFFSRAGVRLSGPFARKWTGFRAVKKRRRYEKDYTRNFSKYLKLPSLASEAAGVSRGRRGRAKFFLQGVGLSTTQEDVNELFNVFTHRPGLYLKLAAKAFLSRRHGAKTVFKSRAFSRRLLRLSRKKFSRKLFFFLAAALASKRPGHRAAGYVGKEVAVEFFTRGYPKKNFFESLRKMLFREAPLGFTRARNRKIAVCSRPRPSHTRYKAAAKRFRYTWFASRRILVEYKRRLRAIVAKIIDAGNRAIDFRAGLLKNQAARTGGRLKLIQEQADLCKMFIRRARLLLRKYDGKWFLRSVGPRRFAGAIKLLVAKKTKKLLWRARLLRDSRKESANRVLPLRKVFSRGMNILGSLPRRVLAGSAGMLKFFSYVKLFFLARRKRKFTRLGLALFKRAVRKRPHGGKRRAGYPGKTFFSWPVVAKIFPAAHFSVKKEVFIAGTERLCNKLRFIRARKLFFKVFFKRLTSARFSFLSAAGFSRLSLIPSLQFFLIRKFCFASTFLNPFISWFLNSAAATKFRRIRVPEVKIWLRGKRFNFFLEKQFEKIFNSNVALTLINPFWASAHSNWFLDLYNNLRGVQSLTAKRMDLWAGYHLVISTLFAIKYKSSALLGKFIGEQMLYRGKKQQSIFLKMLRNFFRMLKLSGIYAGSLAGLSIGIYGKTGGNMLRAKRLFIRRNASTPPPVRTVSLRTDFSLTEAQSKFGTYGIRVWLSYF